MFERTIRWSVRLTIAASVVRDRQAALAARLGRKVRSGGAQSAEASLASAATYAKSAFNALVLSAALHHHDFAGLRVLEIGPGDNLGLALHFLASGAERYVAIDRFAPQVDPDRRAALHEAILTGLSPPDEARARSALRSPRDNRSRFQYVTGVPVEHAGEALAGQCFDLVCSVAVMEHVSDVEKALRAMNGLLAPGGRMVHQVDLRDHGMFSSGGHHPLTFLTIPDWVYLRMISHKGGPNRVPISVYRRVLGELGHDFEIQVSRLVGADQDFDPYPLALVEGVHYHDRDAELIEAVRPHLLERFRALPEAELLSAGIRVVARKPPSPRSG